MLAVADSSALIALAACEGLPLLAQLSLDVLVPAVVLEECARPGRPYADVLARFLRDRIRDTPPDGTTYASALGEGEVQALALARHLSAVLVVDDRVARRVAAEQGIPVLGSIGVLLRAKHAGLLPVVRPSIEAMARAGIRLGKELIQEACRLAAEP